MPNKRTTKEKILAVFLVFFLFLLVASVFGSISLNNKKKHSALLEKVRLENLKQAERQALANLRLSDLPLADLTAKSFITLAVSPSGDKKILAEKNSNQTLPIASISKLMTAAIVLDNINLDTQVEATTDYVGGDGSVNVLVVGQTYQVRELLKNMLIASDNDSARLLASVLGENNFIDLMNKKAMDWNLTHTHFVNSTGLDPLEGGSSFNISSANDLAELVLKLSANYREIFPITRLSHYNFCDIDKNCRSIASTNQFLTDPEFLFKIVGAKTGQTLLAQKNLALIIQPIDDIFLINIVLGSSDNFSDSKTILNHLKT